MKRCLICGNALMPDETNYHRRCAKKLFHSNRIPAFDYTWDDLNALASRIIKQRISVPGVQPKLSLHLERSNDQSTERLTLVGLEGGYILKPPTPDYPQLPEAEHFCMLLARAARIVTADFGLISLKSGELAYITPRMDRAQGTLLHMEDFCQLTNKLTEQKYRGSMEQVGKALRHYSSAPGLDAVRLFELTLFCFLTGNSDMHLKNFSLLRNIDGRLELSPAYDLVPVKIILPEDKEEMALTLNGKKAKLKRNDFKLFGQALKLSDKQVDRALNRITGACLKNLNNTLASSFLPKKMHHEIQDLVIGRINKIDQ